MQINWMQKIDLAGSEEMTVLGNYLAERWDQQLSELEKEKKGGDENFLLELDWLDHLVNTTFSFFG